MLNACLEFLHSTECLHIKAQPTPPFLMNANPFYISTPKAPPPGTWQAPESMTHLSLDNDGDGKQALLGE